MQKIKGKNNAKAISDINIPVENHIKTILDKLEPKVFKEIYDDFLLECERLDIIKQFIFMKE